MPPLKLHGSNLISSQGLASMLGLQQAHQTVPTPECLLQLPNWTLYLAVATASSLPCSRLLPAGVATTLE